MNTKDYLRQIRTIDTRIDNKLEQVERMKSLRERVTTTLTGMPHGGGDTDKLTTITERIWELERQINEDIDQLVTLKTEVRERINAIPDDRYRAVLESKYLCFKTWETIAEDMGYDVRNIYFLHGRALQAYEAC